MSLYGEALAERREICGFETASDMARRSKEIVAELADPQFQAFSQQTLSRLEGDKTGEFIANARPRIQRTISCLLGWRAEEFQARIGVGIPHVPFILNAEGKLEPVDPTAVITVAAPDADPDPTPQCLLPPGLMDAVEEYGDMHPALRKPRVQEQLALVRHWDGGPKTARDWLDFYLDNRRRFTED